jgi:hypothetical protein
MDSHRGIRASRIVTTRRVSDVGINGIPNVQLGQSTSSGIIVDRSNPSVREYSTLQNRHYKLTRDYPAPILYRSNLSMNVERLMRSRSSRIIRNNSEPPPDPIYHISRWESSMNTQRLTRSRSSRIIRYHLEPAPDPIYQIGRSWGPQSMYISPYSSRLSTCSEFNIPNYGDDVTLRTSIAKDDIKREEKDECVSDISFLWNCTNDRHRPSFNTPSGVQRLMSIDTDFHNPNLNNLEEWSDTPYISSDEYVNFEGSLTQYLIQNREQETSSLESSSQNTNIFWPVNDLGETETETYKINELPTRSFKVTSTYDESDIQKSCRVCMEDFKNDDLLRTLPCLHFFHKVCIDKWLSQSTTCPICKFDNMQSE